MRYFKNKSFASQVGVLVTGTAIANAIPIVFSPILTRLYLPEDFGLAALYFSCVMFIGVFATARYELAITLPESDVDAANIVSLCLKLCSLISLLIYLPIFFFGNNIAQLLGNSQLMPWLYLLPISVMANGTFEVFQYWCNRREQYRYMSTSRVQDGTFTGLTNVFFGLAKTNGGMISGQTLGKVIASLLIGIKSWRENKKVFNKISKDREKFVAKIYSNHPRYIAPAQLIGVVAQQIPFITIGLLYSVKTVGFFAIAYKLVTLPTGLIASAIGDVYRQRISVAYAKYGEFKNLFLKTFRKTATIGALPFTILFLLCPKLFALIFGQNWIIAGEYAQVLIVASFIQFIYTPIDKGAVIAGKTRYIFGWQLSRLLIMLLISGLAQLYSWQFYYYLWSLVIGNVSLYLTDIFVEFKISEGNIK